ncbi:MAG TPA: LysR family transcriptional regulator [Casimicrobiaceae bacterium]|nr:LysR family transcriptional regulator [Casimicrobiaceae bacterium]
MLDLRRLRYFVAVAESLHFGRAAARLHMSQPPLSRQIQQLEREIGAQLLRRSKRRVELTDAGAYLLDQARRMLADADTLAVRTRRAESGETGRLTLGFISTVDYSILPGLLSAYRAAHPDVTLELRELTSDVQLRELHEGRIDAGMLLAPVDDAALASLPLLREALVAALPADDPLARSRPALSLASLAEKPFVIFPRSAAAGPYDAIIEFCRQCGFTPRIAQEAIQMQTIVSLVSAGLGVALVPASLRHMRRRGVVYRQLREESPRLTVLLAWRAGNRSACLSRFVATARASVRATAAGRRVAAAAVS